MRAPFLIFLSLGTHEQPFSRAIGLLKPLVAAGQTVVVQHGSTAPRPDWPGYEWFEYLTYEEMRERITTSHAFFCHAGVGSVLTALMHGVTPVIMPRLAQFGEHVDDHQVQLTRKLVDRGLALDVSEGDVAAVAHQASAARGKARGAGKELLAAVRSAIG